MLRVIAVLEKHSDPVGVRIYDESSNTIHELTIAQAAPYLNPNHCRNLIVKDGATFCLEGSLESIPVISAISNKAVTNKNFSILGTFMDQGEKVYLTTDPWGKIYPVGVEGLVAISKETGFCNAKISRSTGDKYFVTPKKGSFAELNREVLGLPSEQLPSRNPLKSAKTPTQKNRVAKSTFASASAQPPITSTNTHQSTSTDITFTSDKGTTFESRTVKGVKVLIAEKEGKFAIRGIVVKTMEDMTWYASLLERKLTFMFDKVDLNDAKMTSLVPEAIFVACYIGDKKFYIKVIIDEQQNGLLDGWRDAKKTPFYVAITQVAKDDPRGLNFCLVNKLGGALPLNMYKVFYVQNHNGAYYVSGKFRDTEGVDRYGTGCDAGIFSVKAKKRISKLLPDKAPNTASMLHIDPSGLVFYAGGRAFNVNNLEYTLPR